MPYALCGPHALCHIQAFLANSLAALSRQHPGKISGLVAGLQQQVYRPLRHMSYIRHKIVH